MHARALPAEPRAPTDALAGEPPGASRTALLGVLAITFALQLLAWSLQRGYPLADVVEYLDRADHWVRGIPLGGEGTIRSFAFSALFVPFFALARWLGDEDPHWVMSAARAVQLALGLGVVLAVARLGARVGGRRAGLAAALVAGANPILLVHSVWPLADVAATLAIALGLAPFVAPSDRRRELAGGVWLGLGFLFAYKALPVILIAFAWCLARDRWRRSSAWLGLASGVGIAVLAQVALDRVVYGEWGSSVWRYVVDNAGSTIVTALTRLGLWDAARALYEVQAELRDFPVVESPGTRQLMSRAWYVEHLLEFASLPVLLLVAAGVGRTLRARIGGGGMLLAIALAYGVLTSLKGDKSFRLWLPILPACAALAGLGFEAIRGAGAARLRGAVALGLVALAVALSPWELRRQSPGRYGVFWSALDHVNALAREHPLKSGRRLRVASSFYWAGYMRNGPEVELVRVWPPLDRYETTGPGVRKLVGEQLDSLDGLLLHFAMLDGKPELVRALDTRFGVLAAFAEPGGEEVPGPVVALVERRPDQPARRFCETEPAADVDAYRAQRGFGEPLRFVTRDGEREEVLALLGVEREDLPGSGERWLVYHWLAETDLALAYRVTARSRRGASAARVVDVREPIWTRFDPARRARGTVLREGRLLLRDEAVDASEAPAAEELWLAVESARGPNAPSSAAPAGVAPDGDGFVRVASLVGAR